MTSHVARLYATAGALVDFFLAWAGVAARPWTTPKPDPRVAALAAREQHLHVQSLAVKRQLDRRWAAYRIALAARQQAIAARQAQNRRILATAPAPAAAPSVRVVTLPALTVTRSS
jgi:hypothetical protein